MVRIVEPMIANVLDVVYLHEDAAESVKQLADIDAIRMPIMIQQILETVWGELLKDQHERMAPRSPICPWLLWVKESQANYAELWNYGMDIIEEHFHRFGSRNMHPYRHGSAAGFERLGAVPTALPDKDKTSMPLSVEQARERYAERDDLVWTNRERPEWLK